MKKIILFFACLLLMSKTYCQVLPDPTSKDNSTKAYYLQKSKRQKTAAWVLLGGGVALAVGAPILAISGDTWFQSDASLEVAFVTGCISAWKYSFIYCCKKKQVESDTGNSLF